MPPRVLTIFGGTGFIARQFLRSLIPSTPPSLEIRLATRRPPPPNFPSPTLPVTHVACDISNPKQVDSALADTTHVLNLTGILYENPPSTTFTSIQATGPTNIAESLKSSPQIQRVVHVSAIGANPDSKSKYASTKAQGEAAILSLRDAPAEPHISILRPSIVFGVEDSFFNRFNDLATYLPFLPLVGSGLTKYQPVHVADVVAAIRATLALHEDETLSTDSGTVYELGGADVLTFRELMQLTLQASGKRRLLLPIPFPVAHVQGGLFELIHRAVPRVPPMLTRDQVELLRYDNVVSDGAKTFKDLGIEARGCTLKEVDYLKG